MATDAQLNQYASAMVLKYLDTYFSSETVVDYLDGGTKFLLTGKAPIISITSIVDTDNSNTTLDSSNYDFYPGEGLIFLDDGIDTFVNDVTSVTWGSGLRRWKITYQAGYTAVPDDVTLAIAMLVTYYRNRPDISLDSQMLGDFSVSYKEAVLGIPPEVKAILDHYRVRHF